MKVLLLINVLGLFAGAMALAGDGGGSTGSGGDGLITMSSDKAAVLGDIKVPVPSTIDNNGQLAFVGTAGEGQTDEFTIYKCATTPSGKLVRFSCKRFEKAPLNDVIVVPAGLYFARYTDRTGYFGQASGVIRVKRGEMTIIELRKIQVPRVNRGFRYSVFVDFNAPMQQEQWLTEIYGFDGCRRDEKCATAAEDGTEGFRRIFSFSADGGCSFLDHDEKWRPCWSRESSRRWVKKDLKDGEWISVFPGTYGIVFKNEETGKEETIYGQKVD